MEKQAGGAWLSTAEACAALGCDRRTLDRLRERGELPARPHGNGEVNRTWRYHRDEVARVGRVRSSQRAVADRDREAMRRFALGVRAAADALLEALA